MRKSKKIGQFYDISFNLFNIFFAIFLFCSFLLLFCLFPNRIKIFFSNYRLRSLLNFDAIKFLGLTPMVILIWHFEERKKKRKRDYFFRKKYFVNYTNQKRIFFFFSTWCFYIFTSIKKKLVKISIWSVRKNICYFAINIFIFKYRKTLLLIPVVRSIFKCNQQSIELY